MVERGGQEIGRSTRGHGCWFNNWPRAECTAFKQRAGGRPAGHEESHLLYRSEVFVSMLDSCSCSYIKYKAEVGLRFSVNIVHQELREGHRLPFDGCKVGKEIAVSRGRKKSKKKKRSVSCFILHFM